jgi:hypothetical protein
MASVYFDWDSSMREAMTLRPEIQKQNITVKKRELELLAAKNFVNPRLDAVGRYRARGFGDNLIGSGNQNGTSPASSLGNLATGNTGEWMLGVEFSVPIGYRKAHAAVDHAELMLTRERMILKEQQREIVNNLSGATADAVRAFQALQNNLNQYLAADEYFKALENSKQNGIEVASDRLLDAQRRLVNAEIQFFRSRAEYAIALKNVNYEKGALLAYKDLRLLGDATYAQEEIGTMSDDSFVLPESIDGSPIEMQDDSYEPGDQGPTSISPDAYLEPVEIDSAQSNVGDVSPLR